MATTNKPAKRAPAKSPKPIRRIVQTLNVNTPGKTYPRNAAKYEAARKAFLELMKQALPASEWGTTQGWWTKTVQLDAEARSEVIRDGGKPLRWKRQ
jgi:hypothetical protein